MFVLKSTYNKLKADNNKQIEEINRLKSRNLDLFCESAKSERDKISLENEIKILKIAVERLGKNNKRGRYAK
jgi:hypothetical protein